MLQKDIILARSTTDSNSEGIRHCQNGTARTTYAQTSSKELKDKPTRATIVSHVSGWTQAHVEACTETAVFAKGSAKS